MIGYALAAATFLATRHAQPVLAGIGYAAFAAALGFGIAAMAIRNYDDLAPTTLLGYLSWSPAQTRAARLANQVQTFESNKEKQKIKADHWRNSLIALIFGTLITVPAILVQTYSHDHPSAGRPAILVHGHRGQPSRPAATASP
jgi:DNA-directed RNA polymerase subunit L